MSSPRLQTLIHTGHAIALGTVIGCILGLAMLVLAYATT